MDGFLLASLLVGTALAASVIGLVLMQLLDKEGQDAPRPAFGDTASGDDLSLVFLFDGEDLVDASPPARAHLASLPAEAEMPLTRLLGDLRRRFDGLDTALASVQSRGQITLASGDHGTDEPPSMLDLRDLGGLLRIALYVCGRENRAMTVDPMTWRLMQDEVSLLRAATARAPMLIWRQNDKDQVVWANSAYLTLAEASLGQGKLMPWPLPALFQPEDLQSQDEPRRAKTQIAGRPHWFEITATPTDGGERLCFAASLDRLVASEASLREFMQTLAKTFAQLPTGLAVFDKERRLQMFNPALVDLTGVGAEFLASRPSLWSVLDEMRERRRLPEQKDYRGWRQHLVEMEKAASAGQYEEVWNLVDGLTYRVVGRPHPDGAIALMVSDITDEVQRSRRYRNDLELGHSVVDALSEAIAVFSPTGQVLMTNTAFAQLWGTQSDEAPTAPDLAAMITRMSAKATTSSFWKEFSEFVRTIGDKERWSQDLRLLDGRMLTCRVTPLEGSTTMVQFRFAAGQDGVTGRLDAAPLRRSA